MKIFLHIGTEKTGTTSIQRLMANQRDELLQKGILYPKSLGFPNNINLSIALQDYTKIDDSRIRAQIIKKNDIIKFQKDLKKNLAAEINETKPHILVISSEHLSSRIQSYEEIQRVYGFLNQFSDDIRVVVYLRRQDQFFTSLYSTAIKKGYTIDFKFPEKGGERMDFHYNLMLKKWEKSFGIENIIVRIFEKNKLYQNDVVKDFIHTLSLPIEYAVKTKKENTSFGRKKLAFLKQFNHHVPEIVDKAINPLRGNIEDIIESIDIEDSKVNMTSEEKINFMKRFLEGNNKVKERYFPDSKTLFDAVNIDISDKKNNLEIDNNELMEVVSKVWQKKQQESIENLMMIKSLEIELEIAKGNLDKAFQLCNVFVNKYPKYPKANFLMAKMLFEKSKISMAKVFCERACMLDSHHSEFGELLKLIESKSEF